MKPVGRKKFTPLTESTLENYPPDIRVNPFTDSRVFPVDGTDIDLYNVETKGS